MRKQTIMENWARDQSGLLGASYVCCFWGDQQQLDRFLQAYAVEKARIEARKKGHSVVEQTLPNGAIKLTIQVGGAT
jgi:hypothetical protein